MDECSECLINYGFYNNPNTRTRDCVYISTKNCLIAENEYPFKCIEC